MKKMIEQISLMTDKEIREEIKALSIADLLLLQDAVEQELKIKVQKTINKARMRRGLIVEIFNKNI